MPLISKQNVQREKAKEVAPTGLKEKEKEKEEKEKEKGKEKEKAPS